MPSTLKTVETVYSLLPAPAGPVFSAAFQFLDFVGYFNQADPTAEAVKVLQQEVAKIAQDVDKLKERVNRLAVRIAQDENQSRLTRLADIRMRLESLLNRIAHQPASATERDAIGFDAGQLAAVFLDEPDLWRWTDLQTTRLLDDDDGHESGPPQIDPLDPDFKSVLAEPIYTLAILAWIAAIDLDTGGNVGVVGQKYGDKLQRHIGQCRMRDRFVPLQQPPETLPENIISRIICSPHAQHKYAFDQECLISIECENIMQRRTFWVRDVSLLMPPGNDVMCVAPENIGDFDQQEIADQEGVQTLRQLADLLEKVLLTGSLRQQFIGWFGSSPARATAFLYAIGQNGDLFWFKQPGGADPAALAAWEGPKTVGSGWQEFTRVYPAGGDRFYGLKQNGDLLWYSHNGFNDGTLDWLGPVTVGSGWQQFKAIVPGSDGVLYALQYDGILFWYKHLGYQDGNTQVGWRPRQQVGNGWQNFKTVFSVGSGVLYAVAADGSLLWYRHQGFGDGSGNWSGPVTVARPAGAGWAGFREIFGVSDGVIFAVEPNGDVLWYQHRDWQTGGQNWQGPIVAARGFGGYRQLFPLMPSTPEVPS
jgi:hypothetical protein